MHFKKPDTDVLNTELSKLLAENKIAIVVPCHNEEKNLGTVVSTLPDYISAIVVIDDASTDNTAKEMKRLAKENDKIVSIFHKKNQGVGGSIASGYKYCKENDFDVAVVMAGDGQMDPIELPDLIRPVLIGQIDYAKGNRLDYENAKVDIPRIRLFGNSILSLLTKIASGYWTINDSQCGYTAIGKRALGVINWDQMFKRYGQPNDLLITLNTHHLSVCDVPVRPVYNVGEVSGIQIRKVVFTISALLLRRFIGRMLKKYIFLHPHPLVLFFLFGMVMLLLAICFLAITIVGWFATGTAPILSTVSFLFAISFAVNSLIFALWLDNEASKQLQTQK
jgi:glycosyltransferase involved in cell wall biosynthesis